MHAMNQISAAELSENCTILPRASAVTSRIVEVSGGDEPSQQTIETIFIIETGNVLKREFDPQRVIMEKLGACPYCPNAPLCQALVTQVGEKLGIGVVSVRDPESFPGYQSPLS